MPSFISRSLPSVCAALSALAVASLAPAAALADEVTVNITHVKALDKVDDMSGADIYAKVTIDGDTQSTAIVKQEEFKPDWKVSKKVKSGTHKVVVELIDKDLTEDDPIDINKLPNRRPLEFTVDTRSCRIEGFSGPFKCSKSITREGKENKHAAITFSVKVKK